MGDGDGRLPPPAMAERGVSGRRREREHEYMCGNVASAERWFHSKSISVQMIFLFFLSKERNEFYF